MNYTNLQLLPSGSIRCLVDGIPTIIVDTDSIYGELRNREDLAILPEIVEYEPTLEDIKEQKKQEINQERDKEESSTFTYLGKPFDCDSISYQRMLGANDLALKTKGTAQEESFSIVWTLADNTHLQMDIDQVLGMVPAFALFSNGLHIKAGELKDQVDRCKSKECIQAITW